MGAVKFIFLFYIVFDILIQIRGSEEVNVKTLNLLKGSKIDLQGTLEHPKNTWKEVVQSSLANDPMCSIM